MPRVTAADVARAAVVAIAIGQVDALAALRVTYVDRHLAELEVERANEEGERWRMAANEPTPPSASYSRVATGNRLYHAAIGQPLDEDDIIGDAFTPDDEDQDSASL